MNQKRLYLLLAALLATGLVSYFLFFMPNLLITNPSGLEVASTKKSLGSAERITLRIPFGKSYLIIGDSEQIITVSGGLLRKELRVAKPKKATESRTDLTKMTPGVISPKMVGGNIYYLGGRNQNSLLSYSTSEEKYSRLAEKDFRGASKVVWSKDNSKVLLYVDWEQENISDEFKDGKKIFLYDLRSKSLRSLDLDEAAFDDNNVYGISGSKMLKLSNGKLEEVKVKNKFDFTGSKITADSGVVTAWNDQSSIILKDGRETAKNFPKINNVFTASKQVLFSVTEESKDATVIFNTVEKEEISWPIPATRFCTAGNSIYAANDKNVWRINDGKALKLFNSELPIADFVASEKETLYIMADASLVKLTGFNG
jgi:hypothetical protein